MGKSYHGGGGGGLGEHDGEGEGGDDNDGREPPGKVPSGVGAPHVPGTQAA